MRHSGHASATGMDDTAILAMTRSATALNRISGEKHKKQNEFRHRVTLAPRWTLANALRSNDERLEGSCVTGGEC